MIQRTKKYRLGRRFCPPSYQVAKPDRFCFSDETILAPQKPLVKRKFANRVGP